MYFEIRKEISENIQEFFLKHFPKKRVFWRTLYKRCDKLETIDALKDSIREAIGEIQLHTIDNVLKN